LIEGKGNLLPRFRCLEDYAFYSEHLLDNDGKEDANAPLAAQHNNAKSNFPTYQIYIFTDLFADNHPK